MGTVTVNGKPLEEHVAEQIGREVWEVRESENRFRVRRPIITRSANTSRAKNGKPKTIYVSGQMETHVIVCGQIFDWHAKAPYVASGASILGGIEYNESKQLVKCHECGDWLPAISKHVRRHHMTAAQYRAKHGISRKRSLSSPSYKARISSAVSPNLEGKRSVGSSVIKSNPNLSATASVVRVERAAARQSSGFGFTVSPEAANLRGKCIAQRKTDLVALYRSLGRTPTKRELNSYINPNTGCHTLIHHHLRKLFGIPVKDIFIECGIVPRQPKGQRAIAQH